jgi:hypothetical protein
MYTRRQFGLLTLSSLALPSMSFAQTLGGLRLGVPTYSFRVRLAATSRTPSSRP